MSEITNGACFCGAVKIELVGEPSAMGYCHCKSCREWSGDPIHAFTIWGNQCVKVVAGEEHLATFRKTPESLSHRQYCTQCGGHLMIGHPVLQVIDVCPGSVPNLEFVAAMHINYESVVLPVKDGLPKFKDFPSEFSAFGGTGETVPE